MESNLLFILLIFNVVLLTTQLGVLFFVTKSLSDKKSAERYDYEIIEKTKNKSNSILHRAIKQAQNLLVTAELKGIKILSEEKLTGKELTDRYREHLDAVEDALLNQFDESAQKAEQSYTQFIQTVEERITAQITKNEHLLEEKSTEMIGQAQKLLDRFNEDVQKKINMQVDTQMQATRNEIDEYKRQRMRVVDEKIIDILEEVLRVTLNKKLSLGDQSELVYKALEEAKHDNTFV